MSLWPTFASTGCTSQIIVYENRILDGRNRYRACLAADIEPTFTIYTGDQARNWRVTVSDNSTSIY